MIPDFLKPENRREPEELDLRFRNAIKRYHEHFKEGNLITEPSTLSREEWVNVIEECIEKDITVWELFGEEYKSDVDY